MSPSGVRVPNIPPKRTRVWRSCFSPVHRNLAHVLSLQVWPEDYHKLRQAGTDFKAAVCLAALVSYW